ncbi:MAG: hypothetical protein BYD32DRAFT_102857 [Podila humilis]|nr:MAG: hypothetical protein BYD32DRAFT_102857 [Podila humilis]
MWRTFLFDRERTIHSCQMTEDKKNKHYQGSLTTMPLHFIVFSTTLWPILFFLFLTEYLTRSLLPRPILVLSYFIFLIFFYSHSRSFSPSPPLSFSPHTHTHFSLFLSPPSLALIYRTLILLPLPFRNSKEGWITETHHIIAHSTMTSFPPALCRLLILTNASQPSLLPLDRSSCTFAQYPEV